MEPTAQRLLSEIDAAGKDLPLDEWIELLGELEDGIVTRRDAAQEDIKRRDKRGG